MKKIKQVFLMLAVIGMLSSSVTGCFNVTENSSNNNSSSSSTVTPDPNPNPDPNPDPDPDPDPDPNPNPDPDPDPKPLPVVEAGAYEGSVEAKIGVGGYEWGPAIDMILFKVNGKVASENLKPEMFTATTDIDNSGNVTVTPLTVIDAYPCTAQGDKIETESEYFAVKFAATYGVLSPFSYDMNTARNSWVDGQVKISIALAEEAKLSVIGETQITTYNAFSYSDPIEIANRVVPSTANLNKGTYTKNDVTLTYAAYETEEMKKDNAKNPLIIWLHGAGEGGTDTDIALLGNDVTNLMEAKIQGHFIDETVKGAYVLAVQTPTMWMNNGTGEYTGDGTSMYLEALMATIKNYAETVNTDIDLNRVYLGGCSNGGYMTVNMLINYGDYFAAAYPICEAYTDAWITDAQIESLAKMNIWFTHAANDGTVAPTNYTNSTYLRLLQAGAKNVYYSYFENIVGTDDPNASAAYGAGGNYQGHFSWIYVFHDQCTRVQSTEMESLDELRARNNGGGAYIVSVNEEEVSLWGWMAAQKKGEGVGSVAKDPTIPDDTPPEGEVVVPSGKGTRYEAENAELGQVEGAQNPITIEENANISGGKGVGYFSTAGQTITFKINSDKAVSGATIKLGVAPAVMTDFIMDDTGFFMIVGDLTLAQLHENATFTMNGKEVTFTGNTLPGNSASNYWNVGEFTATVDLVEGENVFVITSKGVAINVDYIEVIMPEN